MEEADWAQLVGVAPRDDASIEWIIEIVVGLIHSLFFKYRLMGECGELDYDRVENGAENVCF